MSKTRTLSFITRPKWLGFNSPKWDDPAESLGAFIGALKGGRYCCWEAGGRARQAFERLSPEIKKCFEASEVPVTDIVTWSIFMIGRSEETASPKILICSTDVGARKALRRLIAESNIMDTHPGIGVGDISALPDRPAIRRLTGDAIRALLPPGQYIELAVFVEDSQLREASVGMRLFAVDSDDFSLRPMTAGPVVRGGPRGGPQEYFVLTAGHTFGPRLVRILGANAHHGATDDCDWDDMSDNDEMDDGLVGNTDRRSPTGSAASEWTGFFTTTITRIHGFFWKDRSAQNLTPVPVKHHTPEPELRYFGNARICPSNDLVPSLDYALINFGLTTATQMNYVPQIGTIEAFGQIGREDVDVVVVVGRVDSSGGKMYPRVVNGILTTTPSYMQHPGERTFQHVHTLRLSSENVLDGDCGAAVVDKATRRCYGYVVAGSPGSRVAYVIPAQHVVEDIKTSFGWEIVLAGPYVAVPVASSPQSPTQSLASTSDSRKPMRQNDADGKRRTKLGTHTHKVWFCDNCSQGPYNFILQLECVNCGHRRCSFCPVEKVKTRAPPPNQQD